MVAFNFTVPIYDFEQWSDDAETNNTVGYSVGTTFTLDADATLSIINVQDDDGNPVGSSDNLLSDGFIDTPGDGSNPSTGNNDQVLTEDIEINDEDFDAGDQVELEFAFTTTTGETFYIVRIDGENVGITGPTLPVPGTTYEVASSSDGPELPVDDIPCFVDGAMITTPSGLVPIESLNVGDLVFTLDHGAQPITWIGTRTITPLEVMFFPALRPVVISVGALGGARPDQPLFLSPNHRVMVRDPQVEFYFAESEVLVPAKHLVNGTTIRLAPVPAPICYRHLLLEHHEILVVNGLPAESLYPGVGDIPPEQLLELDLHGDARNLRIPTARPVLRKHEAVVLGRT